MKKQSKFKQMLKLPKINVAIFLILRLLVIICMVAQSMRSNWNNVFLCILTLLFFTVPITLQKRLKIEFPKTLEIIIYLFIFASEILGEIQNFYGIFAHWDTMLHTLNGFICAAFGFSLVDILNRKKEYKIDMSPAFMALVSFTFSMTMGVLWEFVEFSSDMYLKTDMQKDRIVENVISKELGNKEINEKIIIENIDKTTINYNNETYEIEGYLDIGLIDTMKDLFVNLIGAFVFSVFGYLYVRDRDEFKFIERFIPFTKKLQEE